MNNIKRVSFIATDIQNDCLKCALNSDNNSCKEICSKIANMMEVPFVYAVKVSEPKDKYYGD